MTLETSFAKLIPSPGDADRSAEWNAYLLNRLARADFREGVGPDPGVVIEEPEGVPPPPPRNLAKLLNQRLRRLELAKASSGGRDADVAG
jgi:hypothetical protein